MVYAGCYKMAGPTPRPFRTAFICAAVAFGIPLVAASITWGYPSDLANRFFGGLLALTMLSAVITGLLARHAKTAWSGVKITVVYIIVVFAGALFYIIGKLPPNQ